jgi:hypothetical protein
MSPSLRITSGCFFLVHSLSYLFSPQHLALSEITLWMNLLSYLFSSFYLGCGVQEARALSGTVAPAQNLPVDNSEQRLAGWPGQRTWTSHSGRTTNLPEGQQLRVLF